MPLKPLSDKAVFTNGRFRFIHNSFRVGFRKKIRSSQCVYEGETVGFRPTTHSCWHHSNNIDQFLLITCPASHPGTLWHDSSCRLPLNRSLCKGLRYNVELNGGDTASPTLERVSANGNVTLLGTNYDILKQTTWLLHRRFLIFMFEFINKDFISEQFVCQQWRQQFRPGVGWWTILKCSSFQHIYSSICLFVINSVVYRYSPCFVSLIVYVGNFKGLPAS